MGNPALIYLQLALFSFLGAVFHLLVKLDSKSKTAKAMKETFNAKQFLLDEKFSIGANIVAQIIVLMYTPELVRNYPELEAWIMGINCLTGFCGSALLSSVLGLANKKLNQIVEDKTK